MDSNSKTGPKNPRRAKGPAKHLTAKPVAPSNSAVKTTTATTTSTGRTTVAAPSSATKTTAAASTYATKTNAAPSTSTVKTATAPTSSASTSATKTFAAASTSKAKTNSASKNPGAASKPVTRIAASFKNATTPAVKPATSSTTSPAPIAAGTASTVPIRLTSSSPEGPPPLQQMHIQHFVHRMVQYTMGAHRHPFPNFEGYLKVDEILFHGNIWKAAYHQNLVYYCCQKLRTLGWDWDAFAALPPPMCIDQMRHYMVQIFSLSPLLVPRIGYPISATLLGMTFFCLLCRFAQFLYRPELVNLVACEFEKLITERLRTRAAYGALASDSGALVGRLNDLEKRRIESNIWNGVPMYTDWNKLPAPPIPQNECPHFYYRTDFHPFIV